MSSSELSPSRGSERGYGARIFLVAMALALATTAGALFAAAGNGALTEAVYLMGLVRGDHIAAEPDPQAMAVKELERQVRTLMGDIATLKSHAAASRDTSALAEHIAKVDAELARLSNATSASRQLPADTEDRTASDPIGDLKVSLAQAGIDIGALRLSLDASELVHRKEIGDLSKRVDRLERLIGRDDVTSSVGAAPTSISHAPIVRHGLTRRRTSENLSGWSVQEAQAGSAIITGRSGSYEVAPGTVVPGIGRVSSVRSRGSRWIVTTDKGTIVQR